MLAPANFKGADASVTDLNQAPVAETYVLFTVDEAGFQAAQAAPQLGPKARARRVLEIWYDTEDFTLARQHMRLRTRKRRGGHDMVLSWAGGEDILPLSGEEPDLAALPQEQAEALQELLQGAALHPVFTTDLKHMTGDAGPGLEMRFLTGTVAAAAGKRKIREVALVQREGDPAALYRLALDLAGTVPLTLAVADHETLALALAGGPVPGVVRSGPGLGGAPSLDEAVERMIRACLMQFTANWPVFACGDAMGAVHQMRVAMRRLRSLLGLFNRAFPCAEFAAFRAEAKRIANTMGEARNWDVFIALLRGGPAAAFPAEPGFAALLAECEDYRAAGYAQARELLADPATTGFVLALEAFLARRGWRNRQPAEALLRRPPPRPRILPWRSLARLHGRVRKRGRHMLLLPAHHRHLVRIELKKLRYAAELFGGLFARRERVRAYNQAASRLQEQLGVLNDLATALELLARLEAGTAETARAAGIVMGWCARGATADDAALGKSWERFRALKPAAE